MPSLRDFTGQKLHWKRQRFFSTTFELRAGDQVLATLGKLGNWKPRVLASADGQQWIFQREGFMKPRFVIYPGAEQSTPELPAPLGSLKRNWRGQGLLSLNDGSTYAWTRTGNWRHNWHWIGSDNTLLLSFKARHMLEIASAARTLPELPLLSLFGFHLIHIMEEEAASAGS